MVGEVQGSRPTLLVQPFDSPSEDPRESWFTRGFVDDLISDLSRFSNLLVVASHSAGDARSSSLSTDFVLGGGLRRSSGQLRIHARLATGDGHVMWADRFDRRDEDVFEVQDEIVARVVASVSARINAALLAAARRKPKTELAAYEHWLQGHDCLKRGTLRADEEARRWFEAALATDPSYGRAYVGLSLSHFNEWSCQLWPHWHENEHRAFEYARRASELDPEDHYAQLVLGRVLLFRREYERAEQHLERSLLLNPNDADCLVQIGLSSALLGNASRGLELYQRAQQLNPLHEPWYEAYAAAILFCLERFDAALEALSRAPEGLMVDIAAYRAVMLHRLGRTSEASQALERYLAAFTEKIAAGRDPKPGEALCWLQHVNPFRRREDEERLLEGVKAVGLAGPAGALPVVPVAANRAFKKVGSLWQASFAGRDAWLPNLKGFRDIHTLLSRAGEEVHCTELQGVVDVLVDDERVDATARAAYQERIRALQGELEEAELANDLGRAERLRADLEALREHLSGALGLGGRSRKLDATVERARSAVTQRIRMAVERVREAHAPLGEHFEQAIRTGVFCSYRPEKTVDWHV